MNILLFPVSDWIKIKAFHWLSSTITKSRLNKRQLIHMDIIKRYRRITHYMFEDCIMNTGRLIVLRLYTDKICESVQASVFQTNQCVIVDSRMETLNIKSLTLEPKLARNWKIYILVQQQDGLWVCWFKKDWLKIKSAMEGEIGTYPIQIQQRGNENIITKTGPRKTSTLSFSIEEWDELRNHTDQIDSIYNLNKVVFYTWKTEEESGHRSFLSTIDCHLDAAQRGIDTNQLSIHKNEIEIPKKTIFIKHIFRFFRLI